MKLTATLEVLMRDLPKILAAGVKVDEVEVEDKACVGSHHIGWHWSAMREDDDYATPDELPLTISDKLQGGDPVGERSYKFQHAAEARKALSDAVIAWARQQNQ